ncbi:TIM barrel protein [Aestuariivirga sp.]|uniref:TIM barrel protein n=1 Tax=Aestuariivirga sp. TaxID=2650926 RepID=UPI00391A9985
MTRTTTRFAYATRLNGFKADAAKAWPGRNRITALDLIERAATVPGLSAVDFNFPDHLEGTSPGEIRAKLDGLGINLNGFAMRYYSDPGFKKGALAHPDRAIRAKALDLTLRGMDALAEAGGDLMTLWLGQDGFDYSFQADYLRLWDQTAEALRVIAAHNPSIDVSIEYKPNEPRAFSLLPDAGTTLLMVADVGAPNLGVTLDFAHVLYADEMPAYAAALIHRRSRLLGVHLNDGYAKRDDGLVAGSVHVIQTLELLYTLEKLGYAKAIYFDTFPDAVGLDPVAECAANISAVEGMCRVLDRLRGNAALDEAIAAQDAVASQRIIQSALYGGS